MIVITENIFSKYIENDNTKIELLLRKILVIYSKFLKRKKLKYFFKYINNCIFIKKKKKIKKRNISLQEKSVHERLFDDSIIRQEMLDNLLSKYLINEEEKYTFYPKINSRDSNYYNNYPYLYRGLERKLLTERRKRPKTYNEKYFFNYINNDDDYNTYYFNKYLDYLKIKKNNGFNSTSSLSCWNNNFSDLNYLYNKTINHSYRYKHIAIKKKLKKKYSIPISTKYNNKLYNSLFRNKDDLVRKENKFVCNVNRTSSSSLYPKEYYGVNKNNSLYDNSSLSNNNISNNNNDYHSYLNDKKNKHSKNIKIEKNKIKDFIVPERNEKLYVDKKIIDKNISINNLSLNNDNNINCKTSNSLNRNTHSTLYNISSIGYSIKDLKSTIDENVKNIKKSKNIICPEKKEHLFSFGSDLFFIDSHNQNRVNVRNKSLIEKMQKKARNSDIKNDRSKNLLNNRIINRNNNRKNINDKNVKSQNNLNSLTGNNHISTNYSGSYSMHNNVNNNKNNSKNSREKNNNTNKLEMQSTNDYCIINDRSDDLKIDGSLFKTTIQTINDSKIFELANNYISQDDSLESYRKKSIIYNKKHS